MRNSVRAAQIVMLWAMIVLVSACGGDDRFGVLAAPNADSATDNNPYGDADGYTVFVDREVDSVTLTFTADVDAAQLTSNLAWETSNGESVPFTVTGEGNVLQVAPEDGWRLACSGSSGSGGNCGTITISDTLMSTQGGVFDPDGDEEAGPPARFTLITLT